MELKKWKLRFIHPETHKLMEIPARVPGNVIGDLLRANLIADPYYGDNVDLLRPWEYIDWEYVTELALPPPLPGYRQELVFEGIDTIAKIKLSGITLGNTSNMFIPHRFDLTDRVEYGRPVELKISLRSALNHARQFSVPAIASAQKCNFETLYLRKAAHSFGWDIAPRIVGAGLWRPVCVESVPLERWTDVYLGTAKVSEREAEMVMAWNFESAEMNLDGLEGVLEMDNRQEHFVHHFPIHFTSGCEEFRIPFPRLWWPRGMGEPTLYESTLRLLRHGKCVAGKHWKAGIRTIDLQRSETHHEKRQFEFQVNGRPVFIKGSNWVPIEAMHGEENRDKIIETLQMLLDLNCNMVRCWGGNVYEDDAFFNFCDENGLMVWQDFMFACMISPLDDALVQAVQQEAEIIVKRLRHHPSLALWCGNNECDFMFIWRPVARKVPPSFSKISREVLGNAVRLHDPMRDYLPSSPYLSDADWRTKSEFAPPEQHLWGPRDNWKSRYYRDNNAIFVSETGYHGMPAVDSIKKFISPTSLNARMGDPEWNCHASQPFGDLHGEWSYRIKLMLDQVKGVFGIIPESLDNFVTASQIIQAEAMKYFIEQFRIGKGKKSGIIWWNIRDCWPQFSDAVVDYYGTKKLAYHYIKKSQEDFTLLLGEPESWSLPLFAVNDRREFVTGRYKISDLQTGAVMTEDSFTAAADAVTFLPPIPFCQGTQPMLIIEWEAAGRKGWNHHQTGTIPLNLEQYRRNLFWLNRKFPSYLNIKSNSISKTSLETIV